MIFIYNVSFNLDDFLFHELLLFVHKLVNILDQPLLVNRVDQDTLVSIICDLVIFEFLPCVFEVLGSLESETLLLVSELSVLSKGINANDKFLLLIKERLSLNVFPVLLWCLVLFTSSNFLIPNLCLLFFKLSLFNILGFDPL